MAELAILLLTIGAVGYIASIAILHAKSESSVAIIINFACVAALVIGTLIACNKVQEVECTKCESKKVVSTSVKYCDVCGSELIPVNER